MQYTFSLYYLTFLGLSSYSRNLFIIFLFTENNIYRCSARWKKQYEMRILAPNLSVVYPFLKKKLTGRKRQCVVSEIEIFLFSSRSVSLVKIDIFFVCVK